VLSCTLVTLLFTYLFYDAEFMTSRLNSLELNAADDRDISYNGRLIGGHIRPIEWTQ